MVTQILIGAGGIAIGAVVAFIIQSALKQSAMTVAAKLKAEAGREAEHVLREAKVTARAEILKMRDEAEAELKDRRREQAGQEKRLVQKEEALDKRAAGLEDQQKELEKQQKDIALLRERLSNREQELAASISRQIDELERGAGTKPGKFCWKNSRTKSAMNPACWCAICLTKPRNAPKKKPTAS